MTRYLPIALPGADVDGADIDAEAVRWSAEHFPEACFHVCGVDPPLPFPAGSFDAVLGGSVFTHLPRGHQATWLAELHRVLAPGGVAVVTTLGDFAVRHRMQHAPPGLAREGIDDSEQDPTLAGVAPAGFYRATYQTRAWTEREWSRTFNVLEFEAGGYSCIQDVWVLRRR